MANEVGEKLVRVLATHQWVGDEFDQVIGLLKRKAVILKLADQKRMRKRKALKAARSGPLGIWSRVFGFGWTDNY